MDVSHQIRLTPQPNTLCRFFSSIPKAERVTVRTGPLNSESTISSTRPAAKFSSFGARCSPSRWSSPTKPVVARSRGGTTAVCTRTANGKGRGQSATTTMIAKKHNVGIVDFFTHSRPATPPAELVSRTGRGQDPQLKLVESASRELAVLPRTGSQTDFPQMKQPPVVQGVAGGCTGVQNPLAGVDGNRTHLATFQTPHWV